MDFIGLVQWHFFFLPSVINIIYIVQFESNLIWYNKTALKKKQQWQRRSFLLFRNSSVFPSECAFKAKKCVSAIEKETKYFLLHFYPKIDNIWCTSEVYIPLSHLHNRHSILFLSFLSIKNKQRRKTKNKHSRSAFGKS